MKILFYMTILVCGEAVQSQTIDSLYQRTYSNDLDYIGIFDNNILTEIHKSNNNRFIFLNNQSIDSTGIKIYTFPKYLDDNIFINGLDNNRNQAAYIFKDNYLVKAYDGEILQRGFSQNLTILKNYNCIYLFKLADKTSSIILNLPERLNLKGRWLEDNQMSITDEFWLDNERLYFNFASCPVSCSDYRHFLFNKSENSLKELKFLKSTKKPTNDEFTCLELSGTNKKYLIGYTGSSLDSNIIGRWLLSDTLKRLTKLLSMNQSDHSRTSDGIFHYYPLTIVGYNFTLTNIAGINYKSELDLKRSVIVPYKFSVPQELAMVKVYYDSLLTKEEVAVFGKYELSILRNLIFAKHNFKFDSDYWQAYFNLFEFYRSEEKRKSRSKEVEKTFSSIDKKNIDMIRKEEKKRNK